MSFKTCRIRANLTQEDVARELSVGRTTVTMWETGAALPRTGLLPRIASLYGCTVDELLATPAPGNPAGNSPRHDAG